MHRPGDVKVFADLSCSVTGSTVEKNLGEWVLVSEQGCRLCYGVRGLSSEPCKMIQGL